MRKQRSAFSLAGLVVAAVLFLLVLFGPAVSVELAGAAAPGEVVARREEISVRYGLWSRALLLDVSYTPADTGISERASIPVDPGRYDRAAVGDMVTVRHMPLPDLRALGEIAAPRLGDQGPLGQVAARIGDGVITFALLGLFLLLLWLWNATRSTWLLLPLGLMLLGGAAFVVSSPPLPAPPGPQRSAQAVVGATYTIDRLNRGSSSGRGSGQNEALQPYTIVTLEFVPEGLAGPVVAVDQIDAGSGPVLERGGEVAIRYSAADPRWARIEGASRSYAWKNLYGIGIAVGAVILALVVLTFVGGLRRQRRPKSPLP
jgi:hypothetical protein